MGQVVVGGDGGGGDSFHPLLFCLALMFVCCFDASIKATKQTPAMLQSVRHLQWFRGPVEMRLGRLFVFCARGHLCSRARCSLAHVGVGGVAEPSAAKLSTLGGAARTHTHACLSTRVRVCVCFAREGVEWVECKLANTDFRAGLGPTFFFDFAWERRGEETFHQGGKVGGRILSQGSE